MGRAFSRCAGYYAPEIHRSFLTPILPERIVQDIAHADATGEVSQEPGDQAGAPRAGVGLQPPASAADPDGTDGADTTLHRRNRGRMPPALARIGAPL